MKFAISLPQECSDGAFDPGAFAAYARRAEELGFDSAWTQEQVLGPWPQLGALETMTFAAACTSRLRIGCSVFVSPLHQPVQLAKSLATLDGRFWQLKGATMEPKPFQKPYPPLWIGGSAPAAVRRAARLADGFFGAGSTTTARFAGQVQVLRAALAERGTSPESADPAEFPVAKRVYIAVGEDTGRVRERMAAALIDVYGAAFGSGLLPVTVLGPPDAWMERLAAEVVPHLS